MWANLICSGIRLVFGTNVTIKGFVPDDRCRVYFANHSSHLDFLLIWTALPETLRRKTKPVAASDYWLKTRIRSYLVTKLAKAVLVERNSDNPQKATDVMLSAVNQGFSLLVFPEGTRSLDGVLQPFKSGLYYLAKGCPLLEFVPVYLENLNRILPKGEFLPVPILSSVSFGPGIQLQPEESKEAFLERARNAILDLIE